MLVPEFLCKNIFFSTFSAISLLFFLNCFFWIHWSIPVFCNNHTYYSTKFQWCLSHIHLSDLGSLLLFISHTLKVGVDRCEFLRSTYWHFIMVFLETLRPHFWLLLLSCVLLSWSQTLAAYSILAFSYSPIFGCS